MSKIIGIDLGTTNSRVAVMKGGEPVVIAGADGSRMIPSAVAFTKGGERLSGRDARRQAVMYPERTVLSVKRDLGAVKAIRVNGKEYYPEHICAMILENLKAAAEEYLGEKVSQAVISVPSCFSNRRRRAVMDAGRIAGLDVVRIISEPAAVALGCGFNTEETRKILVYDLGGGAFDVSVMEAGDGIFEILATAGDPVLGGNDFDARIAGYAAEQFRKGTGIDLMQDRTAARRLKEAAENARIELSSTASANINLPFIAADAAGPKHLDVTLTREKFSELTAGLVERTAELTRTVLKDAGLSADQIGQVVLSGGCTRMPAVQAAIRSITGREPFRGMDPDICVAAGAAVEAGVLSGEIKNLVLLDVTPMSFGLETDGHVFTKLIARNSTIPTVMTQVFSTVSDGQTSVDLHVLQGDSPAVDGNTDLGRFRLDGIAPAPKGVPRIEVAFRVDANGLLNISAGDGTARSGQRITQTAAVNLCEAEIARCAAEEEIYLENAAKLRKEKEILDRADRLIQSADEALLSSGGRLSPEDRDLVRAEIASFRTVRERGAADQIRSAMERFTSKIYDIFGKAYSQQEEKAPEPAVSADGDGTDAAVRLLPVLDDLERAVRAASGGDPELKAGVEMICRKMQSIYRDLGFTEINRPGEKFDPNLEHAVGMEAAGSGKPGTVYRVVQKGYVSGGRVVRYARVTVVPE